jgi:hypothetical protein
VACRLVVAQPGARFLLDQQEAAVALDDGCDADGRAQVVRFGPGVSKRSMGSETIFLKIVSDPI